MKTNENNPFTSKDSPFSKNWSSYNTLDMGKTFFSDGLVTNSNTFYVFDNKTIFNNAVIKDEPLFYKKSELPITIYTIDTEQEVLDTFKKLEIDYDEIAVFFFKKNSKTALKINLGNSLLKLSNFKNEKEMESKTWNLSKTEFDKLNNELSAKAVFQFLNKDNFLFSETVEEITGYKPKAKTKVHFTIGMFFDGTGNNRFNSEKKYYKAVSDKNGLLTDQETKTLKYLKTIEALKEIEIDSSYWNPMSNVALLFDLYDEKKIYQDIDGTFKVTLKQYVQGIGTIRDEVDDIAGFVTDEGKHGIIGKVYEGCQDLAKQIKTALGDKKDKEIGSITFDVFGFSRGAAAARHYCNEVLAPEMIKEITKKIEKENKKQNVTIENVKTVDKIKQIPIGSKYTLGMLGDVLKSKGTQSVVNEYYTEKLKTPKVKIRFVGLFDNVVSQMIVKENLGYKLDLLLSLAKFFVPVTNFIIPPGIGTAIQLSIKKVKQNLDHIKNIDYIFHLIAKDEYRHNFASTPLNTKGYQMYMYGSHSDIGGGYAATAIEKNIVDYEYVQYYTNQIKPKPTKLEKLKSFYIANGFCNANEIKIELKHSNTINKITTNQVEQKEDLHQLITTRKIKPRYSIIPMKVMLNIAQKLQVPLVDENIKVKFEYDTPSEIKNYENIVKTISEIDFKKVYKGAPIKPSFSKLKTTPKIEKIIRNRFVHLSSHYNKSKLIEKEGEAIIGVKYIDKTLYPHIPKYKNSEQNSYEREIYKYEK